MTRGRAEHSSWHFAGDGAKVGFVRRRDPRLRILVALAFALVTVAAERFTVLALALGLAVLLAVAARLPPAPTLRRLAALDGLMAVVVLSLPFTTPGAPVWTLGPLSASADGLLHALAIALKANAVLLALLALVGTLDAPALGHALEHLRVPPRLVQLLLFTVRYLDVLQREFHRLREAMRARGFRPRNDRHTWRSLGYLVGMLLVRSLDRSERVTAAMKCRGFDGRFHRLRHPPADAADWAGAAGAAAVLVALVALEAA